MTSSNDYTSSNASNNIILSSNVPILESQARESIKEMRQQQVDERIPTTSKTKRLRMDNPSTSDTQPSNQTPSDSTGTKEQIEQKIGQWKTHINLPLRFSQTDLAELQKQAAKSSKRTIDMIFWCEDLHISLSRVFSLYKHEIDAFRACVAENIKLCNSVPRLSLRSDKFVELPGSDGDEAFLAGLVDEGMEALNDLVDAVDQAMLEFGREVYFSPRVLHVSLGRYPCRPFQEPRTLDASQPSTNHDDNKEGISLPRYSATSIGPNIILSSGNLVFQLPLSKS